MFLFVVVIVGLLFSIWSALMVYSALKVSKKAEEYFDGITPKDKFSEDE